MSMIKIKQGTPAHRAYVWGAWLFVAFVLVYVVFAYKTGFAPGSIDKPFRISQINDVVAYAVAILGLNLVIGYSGQLSLGHSAFVGLGAYTTIILVSDHNWSYFATIPVAAALCFVIGMIVGLPALRIRGLYLAIVTLSVAFVFPTLVLKYGSLTGGPNGKKPARGRAKLDPPSWVPFHDAGRIAAPLWIYSICMVIAIALFLLARNFVKSRPGRALIAVRDNQTSAAVSGVNLPMYKALTFGMSAAFGGIAGSMLMMNRPFASDIQFGLNLAIFLVVGLVIGGAGTISGAVPGALVYVFVPYFMSAWTTEQSGMPPGLQQITKPLFSWLSKQQGGGSIAGVFFGVLLLIAVFILPGGIIDGLRRLRARIITVVPNPSWLRSRNRSTAHTLAPAGGIPPSQPDLGTDAIDASSAGHQPSDEPEHEISEHTPLRTPQGRNQ
ncbi:MAG: putative branched-chain amino acid transporter permease protein [Ilumatobacteraceae bacterium]|nr:putative branched-chain amino acid transporter permease protein [Ilumatobacteraceae bacterium]